MSGNIAITGVPTTPGPNGAVPLRREIRDLQRNFPDQFNLYVLGLQHLQSLDEQQLASYYQVAGIHGMPYKPWNGVGSTTNWASSSGFGGYCTHSSILFITWHRPYMALYEQALYASVQTVAQRFTAGALRDRYVAAAKDFRAPYFDWAIPPPAGSTAFPTAIASPNVSVVDVDGRTRTIVNPINRFVFHPVNPSPGDFNANWSRYRETVRYPDRSGRSQDARIAPILANELASLRSNVSLLLLSYRNFDAFSYNRWDTNTSPGAFGSLEDVHNEIHDRVGGGGHMSSLEVSSFDPIFWLHHINVDRLWSIWQDLNPTSFMSPRPAPYSTFNATRGGTQDQNTALSPFWDKSGTKFWTSTQVKDSATFGYAYPETQKWLQPSTAAYQAALRQTVTALYGSNVFANFVSNVASRAPPPTADAVAAAKPEIAMAALSLAASVPVEKKAAPAAAPAASSADAQKPLAAAKDQAAKPPIKAPAAPSVIPESLKHLAPNNKYTEWVVNIRAQKHGIGQSFRIQVFLGDIDESNPDGWDTEWNCVGRVSVLGRAPETQCGKCRMDNAEGLMVSGTVPLTSALLQDIVAGELANLEPAAVVPHLKKDLKWKAKLFTGEEKALDEIPELRVSVASTVVTIGEDGLPIYSGQYTVHPEATEGKPAGLRPGDHI
ncbi:common central domain of tyrosinase-domain-containing protein [Cercophora newfieldiana]|uniref:tyrosinase n=1 Tax=Cercophora newfieldiana TaxID=92897 RepID=A0AA39YT88_9PEZI|nr:common central domain of tyrosinase-domain-containing protein [Cercophora newfieldiana]